MVLTALEDPFCESKANRLAVSCQYQQVAADLLQFQVHPHPILMGQTLNP
jgi:hypothetical protein